MVKPVSHWMKRNSMWCLKQRTFFLTLIHVGTQNCFPHHRLRIKIAGKESTPIFPSHFQSGDRCEDWKYWCLRWELIKWKESLWRGCTHFRKLCYHQAVACVHILTWKAQNGWWKCTMNHLICVQSLEMWQYGHF